MGAYWRLFNHTKKEQLYVTSPDDPVDCAITTHYMWHNMGDHIAFAADDREPRWPEDWQEYKDVTEQAIGDLVRIGRIRDNGGVGMARDLWYIADSRVEFHNPYKGRWGDLPQYWRITGEKLREFMGRFILPEGDRSRLESKADRYMNELQCFTEDAIEKGNRQAVIDVFGFLDDFRPLFDTEVENALQRWFFQRLKTRDPRIFALAELTPMPLEFPQKKRHWPRDGFVLHSDACLAELLTATRATDVTWGIVSLRLTPKPDITWVEGTNRLPKEADLTESEVHAVLGSLLEIVKDHNSSGKPLGGLSIEVIDLQPDMQTRFSDIRHATRMAFEQCIKDAGLVKLQPCG